MECLKCKLDKEIASFGNDLRRKNGKRSYCKVCDTVQSKEYRVNHPETYYDYKAKRNVENRRKQQRKSSRKIRSTFKGRLNNRISYSIWTCLNGSKNGQKWQDLVGYSVEELIKHIEDKFIKGMNWENYGIIWEIDHNIPLRVFNYQSADDIDFKKAWALSNLRPLGKSQNRAKGGKIETPHQPSLLI